MTGRLLSLTLAALFSLLMPGNAAAQTLERVPPPIDVHIVPVSSSGAGASTPLVPRGAPVRISGTTVPIGTKGTRVRIEVKPPTGLLVTVNAPIAADRTWSAIFTATDAPGKYLVSAFTADGKNSAMASFTVVSDADLHTLTAILETELDRQAVEATQAIETVQASVTARTPFPDQDAVSKDLVEVAAALAELPARLKAATDALTALDEIARKYPGGASELEPLTSAIQDGTAAAGHAASEMHRAAAAPGDSTVVCARIEAVNEVLGAASAWFDLQGVLYRKIARLATDKFLPDRIYNAAIPPDKRDDAEKAALGESLKQVAWVFKAAPAAGMGAASGGLIDFVTRPRSLLVDINRVLSGAAFDRLCEKYTGPVSGTFTVDATINGGQKFWGYTTLVNATLTLLYEKHVVKGNEPIEMTGEIEGNGSFTMYEDLMAFNAVNRQFVIYRTLIPPAGTSANGSGDVGRSGTLADTAAPGYFRIPVKGTLQGSELTITVGDAAARDFGDSVKGRAIYVVMAPGAPIPYTMMSNLPVQTAQFILSRGLRTTAVLPVSTSTHARTTTRTAAQAFDRKEVVSNGEVTVTWKLDVKACNPRCR